MFRSFFGRIENSKKCFRDLLTFRTRPWFIQKVLKDEIMLRAYFQPYFNKDLKKYRSINNIINELKLNSFSKEGSNQKFAFILRARKLCTKAKLLQEGIFSSSINLPETF